MRHSQDDESHDIHNELKHKIRSSWEMHPCIVHHDILVPSRKQSRRGSDYTCETEPETEPENDLSDSERSLVCQEHREIYQSIHVRRHHHHPLKPSEGNVDILPMPFSDESVGDVIESEASSTACSEQLEEERDSSQVCASVSNSSFMWFRINYVLVMSAIMLADGLQGTHLYVLYEGYGYSVASLYCLGFVTGAVTSPITGAMVDKIGRKKSALLYCALEIFINWLEQYPNIVGLIVSRMIGGITTNLLSSVFETWVDTEYRRRGFDHEKYEIVMRDSVVASNLSAIASGYLAHTLAERFGPVGPFEGAVACTAIALAIVAAVWTENYGSESPGIKSATSYLVEAVKTFKEDSKVLRVGIIQGLTMGSLQIFVFLWSPALRNLAQRSTKGLLGMDGHGEPAYGLIFGAFMAAGVVGGFIAPFVRKAVTILLSPLAKSCSETVNIEGEGEVRPMAVEFLAAFCYLICAGLLLTPCLVSNDGPFSFSTALAAFLIYELVIGIYMPCEGVIRSLYIPSDARCSMMTLPRIIVNVAVSLGVISTKFVSLDTAFFAISCLMMISAALQLSLVSAREWAALFGRVDRWKQKAVRQLSRTQSMFAADDKELSQLKRPYPRTLSMPEDLLLRTVTRKLSGGDGEKTLQDKKDA
jgi:hypothetical protein